MVVSPLKSAFFGELGFNQATSARTETLEGTSVSIFGNLFTILVKKGTSVEKFEFKPKIVLFTGSIPKLDFWVSGRSLRFNKVPPKTKFLLN